MTRPTGTVLSFPDTLFTFRDRNLLTQAQAAKLIGVTPLTWSCWERGYKGCSLQGVVTRLLTELNKNNDLSDQAG